MSAFETVQVDLDERTYDIRVGPGLIANAGEAMSDLVRARQVIVITDRSVAKHWLTPLLASLDRAGLRHHEIVLPAGEQTKNFANLEAVLNEMLAVGIERGTAVVALGGGVIGDLAGFAAATALRGLDFIQIPTTLLSQVDSSVGGKTAINTTAGKNLVGAFHQPRLVLADTDTLATLPKRELLAGYGEVVKYGFIRDATFFEWLEAEGQAVIDGDEAARRHAVVESCRIKAQVVGADERERGERALLNFGHTFGHAYEAEAGYDGSLLHGEAVAVGMMKAFELSRRLGHCAGQDVERARQHMSAIGLPVSAGDIAAVSIRPEILLGHMSKDKKVELGKVKFILARGIGDAFVIDQAPPDDVLAVLREPVLAKVGPVEIG
ncbi:MAG: 3-dehydroquinate synthase [Rhodospirillaceae bacterium]|nr:3-dehydroquinate synthase [Rhodospirillaceae bacterium]